MLDCAAVFFMVSSVGCVPDEQQRERSARTGSYLERQVVASAALPLVLPVAAPPDEKCRYSSRGSQRRRR